MRQKNIIDDDLERPRFEQIGPRKTECAKNRDHKIPLLLQQVGGDDLPKFVLRVFHYRTRSVN